MGSGGLSSDERYLKPWGSAWNDTVSAKDPACSRGHHVMSGGLTQPHLVRLSPAGDLTAGQEASATLGEAEPEDGPGPKLSGSVSFPEFPYCTLPQIFPLV